jgi:cold shock CspA family protein/Tfp pilus assembly protein PilF
MKNLYQLFGVANFASLEDIADAYKKKYAELFSSESPLANIPRLKELKDAFDLLSNEGKREEYDERLADFLEEIEEKFDAAVDCLKDGDHQKAIQMLKWCLSKDPGEADYYETLGLSYRLAGDYENALKSYKQGLQTGRRPAFFHKNLGEVYRLKLEDDHADTHFLEAAEAFKNILKVDPKNVEAMEQLADIYSRMKWYEESLEIYGQLIKRFPYDAEYRRDIGGVLYELDLLEEAEAQLLEALRIKSADAPSLLYLGLVYFKRRLLGMAVSTFHDCLRHNPDQPEVKQLLAQIDTIRQEIGRTVEEIIYDPTPDAWVEGRVKWYNHETGMGMVASDDYPEVLLHFTAIKPEQEKHLRKGDLVRFGVVKDKSSPIAVQVEKVEENTISDVAPGKIERFAPEKKFGTIRSHDGKEVYFPFSALTDEVLDALEEGLEVLFESKSITGLEDNTVEQAVRVRLRKKTKSPKND